MATHSVKVDEKGVRREPIGTVSAPCDEKVWRNMELQAKADGWVDLVWSGADVYHTLYGRRAVLVKTEPTRPAWLNDDEQVIFTTRAGGRMGASAAALPEDRPRQRSDGLG